MKPIEIVVATGNPHKVQEIREILATLLATHGFRVLSLTDVGAGEIPEPEEDGETFADNARIKATQYARAINRIVLADDSGLAVDALDGSPGVFSARWSGIGVTREERDNANNKKLLAELASVAADRRTARFVCAMCLSAADGSVIAETAGEFHGSIGTNARGVNGFGYDPLFVVDASGQTSAELTSAQKNDRSHRGAATRAMAKVLATHPSLS
ncbi:MAG: RdgB/HAM1 family non-canonical purine NTP pyrophosphatase [Planctomycetota bacterium]|nr:RdgB/HAM1 family non-canonical purine NTP pyrophosphatase [Planctomycetota bacterium]MDA1262246.1 RdgB/HAM1 family non-canonical purine NTP pyrophosphatase [Planctomycetota bacterium]